VLRAERSILAREARNEVVEEKIRRGRVCAGEFLNKGCGTLEAEFQQQEKSLSSRVGERVTRRRLPREGRLKMGVWWQVGEDTKDEREGLHKAGCVGLVSSQG